ncbi:MAG: dihydrolipoamide acetyltransferase family protein [Opitutales bacterium]
MSEIIEMPKLSDTMSVGTLVKWLVKEGDAVASGDMLCEVETDKATMEVENFVEGVLLKTYVDEGGQIPVGAPMCAVGEKGESAPEVDSQSTEPTPEATSEKEAAPAQEDSANGQSEERSASKKPTPIQPRQADAAPETEAESTEEPQPVAAESNGQRIRISPLARKLAAEKQVDFTGLKGTGPGGRIVRADIEAAASAGTSSKSSKSAASTASAPSTNTASVVLPGMEVQETGAQKVSNMRGAIARRLVESKTQIPHFYLETEIDAKALLDARKAINTSLADLPPEQGGLKLTVNDFILKATVDALRRVPAVNASWQGDSIQKHGAVHLAFGVAIDDGLITPVVKDAHAKGLRQISMEAKELIGKARNRKLKPDEMTGSTFTVTNLGMFNTTRFYGIINPPNAGILSVGATVKRPVVDAKDNIVIGHRMSIGFSGDHRVVDGATGAQFLNALKEVLETPALMLV